MRTPHDAKSGQTSLVHPQAPFKVFKRASFSYRVLPLLLADGLQLAFFPGSLTGRANPHIASVETSACL